MNCYFKKLDETCRTQVIDILNYYISNTTSAYRSEKVGYAHYDNLLDESILRAYAILDEKSETIGFCTLEKYKSISTFKEVGDMMYFLRNEYTGKGIGAKNIKRLFDDAKEIGLKKIVVDIADDNQSSIRFHLKNGFKIYGKLEKCWAKHGKELGIIFMEKSI